MSVAAQPSKNSGDCCLLWVLCCPWGQRWHCRGVVIKARTWSCFSCCSQSVLAHNSGICWGVTFHCMAWAERGVSEGMMIQPIWFPVPTLPGTNWVLCVSHLTPQSLKGRLTRAALPTPYPSQRRAQMSRVTFSPEGAFGHDFPSAGA